MWVESELCSLAEDHRLEDALGDGLVEGLERARDHRVGLAQGRDRLHEVRARVQVAQAADVHEVVLDVVDYVQQGVRLAPTDVLVHDLVDRLAVVRR